MGVLSRLTHLLAADPRAHRGAVMEYRASAGSAIIPWQIGTPQWPTRDVRTYDTDAYRKLALVFRCVQYVAAAAATAPLRAYRELAGELQELPDHALRALLVRPNPQMGEARFIAYVAMVMSVTGFCVIEKERDGYGNVIALWPLRSDWIRPIPRADAAPDWEYRIPGEKTPRLLKAADAIPVTYADTPDGAFTGIGPLELLLREAGVANSLTDFLKTFLDRGAMPLYVGIPSDDPALARQWQDQGKITAFRAAWRQLYGGLDRAVEPMVVPALKDIKPLGFDLNQLAYVDLHKLTDARICTAFGIPPILLQTQLGLEHATYSNYGQARRSFYEDTMTPLWARLDDALTRHLLNDRDFVADIQIQFDTRDVPALQDDQDKAVDRATKLLTAGAISTHAAQRMAGLEPQGADVFLRPFSAIAVPVDGAKEKPKPASETPKVDDDAGERARVVTRDGRRYLNERALSPAQRASHRLAVAHQKQTIARLADVLAPRMATYFTEQGQRIVAAVTDERATGTGETRAVESIDWQGETDALRQLLEAWLGEVEAQALAATSALLGTDIPAAANPLLASLVNSLGYRIRLITDETRAAVETIVRESLLEGTTMPELAGKIEHLFAETYESRHLTVARTESMMAYGRASELAYQQSGVVSEVMVADNASHSEPYTGAADALTCAQRDGLVVAVGQGMFHVGSDHPNGSACLIPLVDEL